MVVLDRLINMISGLVFSVVALALALPVLDAPSLRSAAIGYGALAIALASVLAAVALGRVAGGVADRIGTALAACRWGRRRGWRRVPSRWCWAGT